MKRSAFMAAGDATPKLLPLAAEMTKEERATYERDCLAELEKRVRNLPPSPHRFHEVRETRLEGTYPSTAIWVRWFDTRYQRESEDRWNLWISRVTRKPPGVFEYGPEGKTVGREVPEQVAMLIHVWIQET
jgi:hypothetical protein